MSEVDTYHCTNKYYVSDEALKSAIVSQILPVNS